MKSKLLPIYGCPVQGLWERDDGNEFYLKSSRMSDIADERRLELQWATVVELENLNIFNSALLDYLRDLPDVVYNHREVGCHIRHFIEQEVQYNPGSFQTANADCLKEDLGYLAFTEEVAQEIVGRIDESVLHTREAWWWALFALEKWVLSDQEYSDICKGSDLYSDNFLGLQFEYYLPCYGESLFDQGDYPYSEGIVGKDFIISLGGGTTASGGAGAPVGERYVTGFNAPLNKHWNQIGQEFVNRNNRKFYFHGTTWLSAIGIAKDGPSLLAETCQDFSFPGFPGFYVSNDFSSAAELARGKGYPAVVVFNVDDSTFNGPRHVNIPDTLLNEQKLKYYRYCRSGGNGAFAPDLVREIRDSLSITGPILKNTRMFRNFGTVSWMHHSITQTCIHGEGLAEIFKHNIYKIVFFQPVIVNRQQQRQPRRR